MNYNNVPYVLPVPVLCLWRSTGARTLDTSLWQIRYATFTFSHVCECGKNYWNDVPPHSGSPEPQSKSTIKITYPVLGCAVQPCVDTLVPATTSTFVGKSLYQT